MTTPKNDQFSDRPKAMILKVCDNNIWFGDHELNSYPTLEDISIWAGAKPEAHCEVPYQTPGYAGSGMRCSLGWTWKNHGVSAASLTWTDASPSHWWFLKQASLIPNVMARVSIHFKEYKIESDPDYRVLTLKVDNAPPNWYGEHRTSLDPATDTSSIPVNSRYTADISPYCGEVTVDGIPVSSETRLNDLKRQLRSTGWKVTEDYRGASFRRTNTPFSIDTFQAGLVDEDGPLNGIIVTFNDEIWDEAERQARRELNLPFSRDLKSGDTDRLAHSILTKVGRGSVPFNHRNPLSGLDFDEFSVCCQCTFLRWLYPKNWLVLPFRSVRIDAERKYLILREGVFASERHVPLSRIVEVASHPELLGGTLEIKIDRATSQTGDVRTTSVGNDIILRGINDPARAKNILLRAIERLS